MITEKEIQSFEKSMSEMFRQHDYRAMYQFYEQVLKPAIQSRQAAVSGSLPPFRVIKVEKLKRGDFFLWQGRDGVQEIHQYHSDAGYGIKTFTDYSELDESSMLVNWSGVVGKIEVGGNDR